MTFEQKLDYLNAQGHKFHVFQSYGEQDEARGHSMSFHNFLAAKAHANRVPGGIVYDPKGNDVSFNGE
jgi:hypothetical protein